MSLDDERVGWKAAEQIERGDLPLTVERQAAQRIGKLIAKHQDPRGDHSERYWTDVGGRILAHEGALLAIFDEVRSNPHRIGGKDPIVLRQQVTGNRADDLTWAIEEADYHKRAYEAAVDMADRITAHRLAEHDVDLREQDRENDRLREVAQDEAAREAAPRGVAS